MNMQSTISIAAAQAATILIVDDMEANRAVVTRRLEKQNYIVSDVDSGRAALDSIQRIMPDVVLLDYMMPNMNGIEVLRHLRADPKTRTLPVIMVTARAEASATVEALEAGADDYVTKPIDFEVLCARIETQLAKRRDIDEIRRSNVALGERVTLRSMTLANLETELKEEIQRRQELERQMTTEQGAPGAAPPMSLPDLASQLIELERKFEIIFNAVLSGKLPNLAQMAEFKMMLAKAKAMMADTGGAAPDA
jgi:DNA-binding response OmpR family regulator